MYVPEPTDDDGVESDAPLMDCMNPLAEDESVVPLLESEPFPKYI
jgi:hypothetical protein